MRGRYYIIFFCCLQLSTTGRTQLTVQFNAAIYGQTLEGLSFAQIVNATNETVKARLTVRVREAGTGNIVTAAVPGFWIKPGGNSIDRVAYRNSRFAFGSNDLGRMVSQSGKFPEGEYEYCFELEILEAKLGWGPPFFEFCFNQQLQPLTPLLLINPVDGDESCNERPTLSWQPPMPMPLNGKFRLLLTELKDKQDPSFAILYNTPIIYQDNIPGTQLPYPGQAPALKQGRSYAWQVILYNEKIILKRSEVWTYTVKCAEAESPESNDSYRELKEYDPGGLYIAHKFLRFSFNNSYNPGNLDYTITSMARPEEKIGKLPELKLLAGMNKYALDLTENRNLKTGEEYLLRVRIGASREFKLRFIYKGE